jgi:hypothetical protein
MTGKDGLVSTDYVPSREDRFSFGIWTVGWQGVDVFGSAVRPPMPAERAVYKLAELGAYGVNFQTTTCSPSTPPRPSGTSGSAPSARRWPRPAWW